MTALEKLESLRLLKSNWDSYGAASISPEAIATASQFLQPDIVPTSQGGIQLEWHNFGIDLEIEITPAGKVWSLYMGGIIEREGLT